MRMYSLRIFHSGKARLVPLEDAALTVGSASDNDVVLDDSSLPALAFGLTLSDSGYVVRSIQHAAISKIPLVNGVPGEGALLRPGDRLELGSFAMILEAADAVEAPERPGLGEGLSKLCAWVAEERDLKALLEKAMQLLLQTFGADEAFLFHLEA